MIPAPDFDNVLLIREKQKKIEQGVGNQRIGIEYCGMSSVLESNWSVFKTYLLHPVGVSLYASQTIVKNTETCSAFQFFLKNNNFTSSNSYFSNWKNRIFWRRMKHLPDDNGIIYLNYFYMKYRVKDILLENIQFMHAHVQFYLFFFLIFSFKALLLSQHLMACLHNRFWNSEQLSGDPEEMNSGRYTLVQVIKHNYIKIFR